jgi:hypothetical protein
MGQAPEDVFACVAKDPCGAKATQCKLPKNAAPGAGKCICNDKPAPPDHSPVVDCEPGLSINDPAHDLFACDNGQNPCGFQVERCRAPSGGGKCVCDPRRVH